MGGLGLLNLGFLAATAAVAVPIAIHLLLRPRARRVDIGSVRFLHRALRDSTRRRKVRRWLLFALRVLAVLLLALLFARPYLRGAGSDGRDREVVLLIDQSASMGAVQSGRTLFAHAQEAAAKVLKELPEQTAVHLAYFDAQGVAPSEETRVDAARQPGHGGTDYLQAMRWARDQLVLSSRSQRTVYLFSDLQRTGRTSERFDGFPFGVNVELIEIGRPLLRNLAVARVEATQTVLRPKEPIAITAQVRNLGPFAANNIAVRLMLDRSGPQVKQVRTLSVGAASTAEVRFEAPIEKASVYAGHVEITGDDEFPADDRRWIALDVRPPDRLLLVDGQPGVSVFGNETYYLEAALRLRLSDKDAPLTPYEPTRLAWTERAALPDLASYRAVVLCNVARLGDGDIKTLRAFVERGGGLIVFTGDRVRAEGYRALEQAGLLPASVEGPAGPDLFRFGTWDREHPILRPLSDPQLGDLRRISFHHITRLKPAARAKLLASAQTGEPLLVEDRLGDGKILLMASAADRDWSDWPQGRLYVPLIHQLVGFVTDRLPEMARVQNALADRDHPPGITHSERGVVVRNLDPGESEIARWTMEEFRQMFHLPEAQSATERGWSKTEDAAALPGSQRSDEVWMYVLWALLLLLVVEVFVANRTSA